LFCDTAMLLLRKGPRPEMHVVLQHMTPQRIEGVC